MTAQPISPKSTALVTGAASSLGSHLIDVLLAQNLTVIGIDDLKVEKKENLSASLKSPRFSFIEADITEVKKKISDKKQEIQDISNEIEQKGEKEQVAMHKQVEQIKVSLATNKTRIDNCKGEIVRIIQRKDQLKSDLQTNQEQLNKLKEPGETDPVLQEKIKNVEADLQEARSELAESEKAELAILETYLPQMMAKEDIQKVAEAKKAELGIDDKSKMGMLMGAVMKELAGRADGSDVKQVIDEMFN